MPSDATVCCALLLLVSIAMAAAGLFALRRASDHARGRLVALYDDRVDAWNARWRSELENTSFSAVATRLHSSDKHEARPPPPPPLRLQPITTNEGALHDTGHDLRHYTPLRHEWRGPLGGGGGGGGGGLAASTVEWSEARVRISLHASGTTIDVASERGLVLGFRELGRSGRSACGASRGGGASGSFDPGSGVCEHYYSLAEVCVKVRRDGGGGWVADPTGGGIGCEAGERGLWSPARYARVAGQVAPAGPAYERAAPAAVAAPLLRVRHAADPLIAARNLTHDSLAFGTPDFVKLAGGVELLVCAAALAIPALVYFCAGCCAAGGSSTLGSRRRQRGDGDGDGDGDGVARRPLRTSGVLEPDDELELMT